MKCFKISMITCLCLLLSFPMMAQKAERKQIREGNKQYEEGKFTEAEIAYRKALEVNEDSPQSTMNLGNALYRQEKAAEALEQYKRLISDEDHPERQADAYHNIGNVMMQAQDYKAAIQAYQQSLIKRPSDNETRYNLALAQALLKQQEQQQNQDQQDENQQQEQQEQEQQQQQEQPQEQENQQQQEQQQEQEQQDSQEQISKEQAQQLLDALMQDEEEVQEKVKELQMQQSQGRKTDKDW